MSNVFVNDESLTAVANVIRSKNSTENTYKPTKMADAVAELPSYDFVKNLIERPYGCKEIVIPDYVTKIGYGTFAYNLYFINITIPDNVTEIGACAFLNSTRLTSVTISDGVTIIQGSAFHGCSKLTNITIPNSVTSIGNTAFNGCKSLEFVKLGQGFNANNPDLSASTKYTRETIVSWLNALADRTGQTAYKLIIGPANLKKLTQEDIAIATAKNWTLA